MIGVGIIAVAAVGIEFVATRFGVKAAQGFAKSFGSQLSTLKYLITQAYYMYNPNGGVPNPIMSLSMILGLSVLQFIVVGGSRFADSTNPQDQANFRAAGMVDPSAGLQGNLMQAAQVASAQPSQGGGREGGLGGMSSLMSTVGSMLGTFFSKGSQETVPPPFETPREDYIPASSADAYAQMSEGASNRIVNPSSFAGL
jgi:hypothetical protein